MAVAMNDPKRIEALIRDLDAQKEAYFRTVQQAHEILAANLAGIVPTDPLKTESSPIDAPQDVTVPRSPPGSPSRTTSDREVATRDRKMSTGFTVETSSKSRSTGHDSDLDNDESYFVLEPLLPQAYDVEAMRSHIRGYRWDQYGKKVMDGVITSPARLSQASLIPSGTGRFEDRSDLAAVSVFDVGPDGSPLPVEFPNVEKQFGRAMAIWHTIKDVNPASKQRHAVGRITIMREPSPILFGAIHYTMNKYFCVDEFLHHLVSDAGSTANIRRAFEEDERKQRSFVFNFEYFTLIGKDCEPMKWQMAAGQEDRKPGHIQISRCSSTMGLYLAGPKIREVKNPSRKARKEKGAVYDPWSPWLVLNIQCYPDFKSRMDVHDSSKHYVNGVEAFMTTLLGEYRDAKRRFEDITDVISKRVRPPLEFMFSAAIRDRLLFEDRNYSMAKRYFWAHQTLGIMNESIKALVDAYEDEFTDDVWQGKSKIVWPLLDEHSPRNVNYRKKMTALKKEFEAVIESMKKLMIENNGRRREITGLREDLFTGTSIEESRRSVDATETTVQQGHNIKILTLVSIFFLPLTFVTSVFGMTNMPPSKHFYAFAIVTATVCVPFFVLIGSLNTNRGMAFWKSRTKAAFHAVGEAFAWIARGGKSKEPGLLNAKSFESTTSASGIERASTRAGTWRLQRRSSTEHRRAERMGARARTQSDTGTSEPTMRENERPIKAEDGPPLSPMATRVLTRPSLTEREHSSHIAEMWADERRRRQRSLRYTDDTHT